MGPDRREFLRGGGLGLLGAGFLTRFNRVADRQQAPTLSEVVRDQATGDSEALLLGPTEGEEGPPAPADFDRLTLEWNRRTVQRFQVGLVDRDVQAFLVRQPNNIIYLTGYWHTTTERPQAVFMNLQDQDPWFLYPSLDRDLVTSWWFGGGEMYFDFHHAEGAFPHLGEVQQGEKVDLFRLLLKGIKKHGIQGNRIGVDGELYPSELAKAREILPDIEFVDVSADLLKLRMVKTPEELALWRRAYVYFDRAHCFARDYILTHGTDITDYEVKMATELWINQQLWSDVDLGGGQAHHGVRTAVGIGVRAGPVTAYPHPNQPYFNEIGKNMALQVAGIARVGGYGHELYRPYILADGNGRFDEHMQHLWTVSRDCCHMQNELSKAGVTCSSIAYQVHQHQLENGVAEYVYHRPAHGAGVEGHQAPYLALGDYTMLEKDMCFSEEPGLYDTARGVGFNWSNTIVVGERSGWRMSRVPYTSEWCWLTL